MDAERKQPLPGERYRHFKDRLYQIVAVAEHSETGEAMVVYQALYGTFKVWVRPLAMFMGEVDREKYPDVKQKYRFELVETGDGAEAQGVPAAGRPAQVSIPAEPAAEAALESAAEPAGGAAAMNPHLLSFFDAMDEKNYDKMLECLAALSKTAVQKEVDDLYMVLDMKSTGGTISEQLAAVRAQLLTLKKFNGERLR